MCQKTKKNKNLRQVNIHYILGYCAKIKISMVHLDTAFFYTFFSSQMFFVNVTTKLLIHEITWKQPKCSHNDFR